MGPIPDTVIFFPEDMPQAGVLEGGWGRAEWELLLIHQPPLRGNKSLWVRETEIPSPTPSIQRKDYAGLTPAQELREHHLRGGAQESE